MANNKYMQEVSVEELVDEINFFIPEIQREYVWGYNEREILDTFCEDIKEDRNTNAGDQDLGEIISKLSKQGKFEDIKTLMVSTKISKPMNIGFLYSYQPNYRMEHFPESDFYKDVYLIDGQQRLTTLFIILFYLSIKENRKNDFITMFRFNSEQDSLAFDYRVRNLTHNFFIDLISNVITLHDLENIEQSTWFLKEYANDPTIKSVIKANLIISNHFKDAEDDFFDYLKTRVKFWHFKTEKTDQGEELYITMNSRGKQLEDNETIRAKLFEKTEKEDELYWSEEWEKWQNFFWKNRDPDKPPNNSDKGFNEFLKCISGLEAYKTKSTDFLYINDVILPNKQLKFLKLDRIKKYFDSLEFLFSSKEKFIKQYEYSEWIENSLTLIKKLFFQEKTNWFVDYEDSYRANERRNMVFIWSLFEFITSAENNDDKIDEIFRFVRVYWLRYNNHDRSVKTISDRCNSIIQDGIWSDSISDDEKARHEFLRKIVDKVELRNIESSLWKLEDHPLNINGYQVRNQNITHLIDFTKPVTVEYIDTIFNKFNKLFKHEKPVGSKKLNTVLLYYSFYGMKRTPNYYDNWDFSSWRRIIRDLDSKEKGFKLFFNEYNGSNLKEILDRKKNDFILEKAEIIKSANTVIQSDSLIDTIRLYDLIIEDLWLKGRSIAESHYAPNDTLTSYEGRAIFNTKGDFRGYGHEEYCFLAKKVHAFPLEYLKQLVNKNR